MIDPPRRSEPYPGMLPPVRQQWSRLAPGTRAALVVVPAAAVAVLLAVNLAAGVTAAVLSVGVAAATATFVKNRYDRHNAAVAAGEVAAVAEPELRELAWAGLPEGAARRLRDLGCAPPELRSLLRFDGGWIARTRSRRGPAAVVGDDGSWARFDPRAVGDAWAVSEFRAGRGRDGWGWPEDGAGAGG